MFTRRESYDSKARAEIIIFTVQLRLNKIDELPTTSLSVQFLNRFQVLCLALGLPTLNFANPVLAQEKP